MRIALLVFVACSHPPHVADPDDTRGGATAAVRAEMKWTAHGSLDANDGVDWIRIELPTERHEVELSVITNDARDGFDSEIYAAEGARLAVPVAQPTPGSAEIRDSTVTAAGLLYVRVAANAKHARGTYDIVARATPIAVTPPPKTPCDSDAFDPANPECTGKCDFKHPDPKNQDCCALWRKCQEYPATLCNAKQLWWSGDDVVVPLGLANGVHGQPPASLILDAREPVAADPDVQRKRLQPIELRASAIEDTRSTWSLVDNRSHDLTWLHAHAKRVEIEFPLNCR